MTMNPKERLLGAVADLQRFVVHHPDQARCPVCPRWDELQGAAMQAVTAIDDHEAELAALRAELAVLRNNQLGPVPEGPLKALGAWVADHTDDDTWPNAERYLNAALAELAVLRERNARLVGASTNAADVMERAKKLLRAAGFSMKEGTISGPYNEALAELRTTLEDKDDTWPNAERYLNAALAEMEALRAERAITASPWRYKEWGGLVVGGGEGSAEVLICTMATNTRHDEGRHNRELIIEAPTLRARLDKAEAEAARLRALNLALQQKALDGYRAWDLDQDAKAGKVLKALAGLSPGYWPDIDALRAALGKTNE